MKSSGISIGQEFGQLIVLEQKESDKHIRCSRWLVRCSCGREKIVSQPELVKRDTVSCGCLKRERARVMGKANKTHGESWSNRTPEYMAWQSMIKRCHSQNFHGYENWGGRGIIVCERWRNSFEEFLEDVGRRPSSGHSLDRINNNSNYEPGNVRWTDWGTQANNRRQRKHAVSKEEQRRLLTLAGYVRCDDQKGEKWKLGSSVPIQLASAWKYLRHKFEYLIYDNIEE